MGGIYASFLEIRFGNSDVTPGPAHGPVTPRQLAGIRERCIVTTTESARPGNLRRLHEGTMTSESLASAFKGRRVRLQWIAVG